MVQKTSFHISFHIIAVVMLGVVSQVGQVLVLRELLVVFHGNELSIGLILAFWLLWVAVGSRLGATLMDKRRFSNPLLYLKLSSLSLMLILPGTILLIRNLRGFFDILPGAYLSLFDMITSSFLIMAPVCLILGAKFVLLSRVWREHLQAKDSKGAEKTYVGEAAGNVLGGILFSLVMVHYFNSFQGAVLVSVLMLFAVSLIGTFVHDSIYLSTPQFVQFDSSRRFNYGLAILSIFLIVSFPFYFSLLDNVDEWAYGIQWEDFAQRHELIETHQSPHGVISIARYENQYSFFQNGHLLYSTAGPEMDMPGQEEQDALDFAHLAMAGHRAPEDVLLIGGGMRGTLGEILKHPVERVDYIERDEILTEAAKPHVSRDTYNAIKDPRVNLTHKDGRLFVKTAEDKYDMVIVDTAEPVTADLNRYYTREFFSEVKDLLASDGVFVTSVRSTPDLRETAIANRNTTIYHTLDEVYERVLPAGEEFMMYFATNEPGQITLDAMKLQERFLERDIEETDFSPYRYQTLLEKSQLQRVNSMVRSHGRSSKAQIQGPGAVPIDPGTIEEQELLEEELPSVEENYFINSDFKPIGYFYSLMFWENLTRQGDGQTLKNLLHVESWWIGPLALVPVLGVIGLKKFPKFPYSRKDEPSKNRTPVNFAIIYTVFTTGLSTMTLQIALLFSFQSIYGFVYEMVGLITAIFMCGLALGAQFTHSYITKKASINRLIIIQAIMTLFALLIAILLPFASTLRPPALVFGLFSFLTLIAGLINGIDFPLAISSFVALNKKADRSTGIIYGVELIGACLGAIVASAVVAPVLGIISCGILAAVASGTAVLVLLLAKTGKKEEILS